MAYIGTSFSRTPRGFEATNYKRHIHPSIRLSAEPLVGLKRCLPWVLFSCSRLSAEPLVGLKPHSAPYSDAIALSFSRTPRGFEAAIPELRTDRAALSAEPLVGLKPALYLAVLRCDCAFSRTPRGFEATPSCAVRCCTVRLSAEPLVGLKPPRSYGLVIDHSLSAEPLVGLKQSAVDSGVAP